MSARWQPAACAKPLRSWSLDQRQALCCVLDEAVSLWASAWGLVLHGREPVTCAPAAADVLGARWGVLGCNADAAAWLVCAGDIPARIHAGLFESAPTSPLALDVGRACAQDGKLRLMAALRLHPSDLEVPPPRECGAPWSGSVVAMLPIGTRVLLNATAVQALLQAHGLDRTVTPTPRLHRPPLVAMTDALADAPFPLQVQLEGCELDIGDLQDLQVGDVLRMKHRLELPALVRSPEGSTLFRGYLARSRGRKVIELAPAQ